MLKRTRHLALLVITAASVLFGQVVSPPSGGLSIPNGASTPGSCIAPSLFYNTVGTAYYGCQGTTFAIFQSSSSGVTTVAGTTRQVTASTAAGTATLSLPTNLLFPGNFTAAAGTTGAPSFNVPSGVAPTSPTSGDFWNLSGVVQFYDGSATQSLMYRSTVLGSAQMPAFTGGVTNTGLAMKVASFVNGVNVLANGVTGNGSTNDGPAIATVFSSNPGAKIVFPKGTYLIDNSAGPLVISSFSGEVMGEQGATIECNTLANSCLEFSSPVGVRIHDLVFTYTPTKTTRNGAFLLYVTAGNNVDLANITAFNANGAGVVLEKTTYSKVSGLYIHDVLANGFLIANSSHVAVNGISGLNNGDGMLEATYYDANSPSQCTDIAVTGLLSNNDGAGFISASCQRVSLNGFEVNNTFGQGVSIRQDTATTSTVWPDDITIANGTVNGAGAGQTTQANQQGVIVTLATAASSTTTALFSNIKIKNSSGDGFTISDNGTSTTVNATLSNITVDTTGGANPCFRFGGGVIIGSDLHAANCNLFAYDFSTTGKAYMANLYSTQPNVSNSDNRAVVINTTGDLQIDGLALNETYGATRSNINDVSASGAHSITGLRTNVGTSWSWSSNGHSTAAFTFPGSANVGPAIASASTITPVSSLFHVTGTTAINTITAPTSYASTPFGGCLTIIPDGLITLGTSGNISVAVTAVVGQGIPLCYDNATAKWYPSGGTGSGGGGGGTGNAGALVTTTFSGTPTFTCPSSSAGTEVSFSLTTALSASITSSTLASCTSGSQLNFRFTQAASTTAFTVAMPTGFSAACQVSPIFSSNTNMSFIWDGTTARLIGCSVDSGPGVGLEIAAPSQTPISGSPFTWQDSTSHFTRAENSSSQIFQMALELSAGNVRCAGGANTADANCTSAQILADISSAAIANAKLTNPATTVDGQTCTLGSTCTTTFAAQSDSIASAHVMGTTSGSAPVKSTAADLSAINYVAGGGSANAQTATYAPAVAALTDGLGLCWLPTAANTTTTPTFAPNGLTAHTLVKVGAAALASSDLTTTAVACAIYNLAATHWELQNPQTTGSGVTSVTGTGPIASSGGTTPAISCSTCGVTGSPLSQFSATTSAQLAGVISDETGTGSAVFNTSPAITTPAITGLATGSGVASAATASTLASRDANANLSANSFIEGYATTATAAGTTTLTVSSAGIQYFTGSTTQTVLLPVTSTLVLGQQFYIANSSTGAVTINSSGSNAVIVLAANTSATITCILTSGTTATSWSAAYFGSVITSGKSLSSSNSITLAGTDGTTMTFPSSSATITQTIASGTSALGTSSIATQACATVVTTTATGTASTDAISWTPNGSIKAVTGYVPLTTGGLSIAAYPTANNVNFDVCNWTSGTITPGALTINWRVAR